MHLRIPLSSTATGILLMLGTALCFAVMNILISSMSGHLPSSQMVFMRNLFGLLIMLPVVLSKGWRNMPTQRLYRHFWRSFIGIIAMETWFLSLSQVPVNEATALSFTSPLFGTLFAVFLLKEKIGPWRIAALMVGFLGTLIILRPDPDKTFELHSLTVLFSTGMMALAGVVVKSLTATDPPWRIVAIMACFMTLLSAPLGLWNWQAPEPLDILCLFGIALSSTTAQLAMASAFRLAPVVLLMPFDFMRLVFTALLAYIFFGQVLDGGTLAGASVILFSAVFIAWREARWKKREIPHAV